MARHQQDTATYRQLDHKERVQSFNATVLNLEKYVRVQIESDTNATRPAEEIKRKRILTLQRTIRRIADL